jgi:hypothetical protein
MKKISLMIMMSMVLAALNVHGAWTNAPGGGGTTGSWVNPPVAGYTNIGIAPIDTQHWQSAWLKSTNIFRGGGTTGALSSAASDSAFYLRGDGVWTNAVSVGALTAGSNISALVNDAGYLTNVPSVAGMLTAGSNNNALINGEGFVRSNVLTTLMPTGSYLTAELDTNALTQLNAHTGLTSTAHGGVVMQSTTGALGVAYAANAGLLDGIDSTAFMPTGSYLTVESDPDFKTWTNSAYIQLGNEADASEYGLAIGLQAKGTNYGMAIGASAYAQGPNNISIGNVAIIPDGYGTTIQIGQGTATNDGWVHFNGNAVINQTGDVFNALNLGGVAAANVVTNNGTVDHLYTTTASGYAGNELVSADFVRSVVASGADFWPTTNKLATTIIPTNSIYLAASEPLPNVMAFNVPVTSVNHYVMSIIDTNVILAGEILTGPATVEIWVQSPSGAQRSLSVAPEIYYIPTQDIYTVTSPTNGDWSALPQVVTLGTTTNRLLFTVPFPNTPMISNSYRMARLKVAVKGNNTTNLVIACGDGYTSHVQMRNPIDSSLGSRGATNVTMSSGFSGVYDAVSRVMALTNSGNLSIAGYGITNLGGIAWTNSTVEYAGYLNGTAGTYRAFGGTNYWTLNAASPFDPSSAVTNGGTARLTYATSTVVAANVLTAATAVMNGNTIVKGGTLAVSNEVAVAQLKLAYNDTYYSLFGWHGGIDIYGGNNWNVSEAGVPRITVATTTGNLGVGTNAPAAKLHVAGNALLSGATDLYQTFNVASTDFGYIGSAGTFFSGQPKTNLAIYGNGYNVMIGGRSSPDLTIANDGNIGIGTNAPAQKLHLRGVMRVDDVANLTDSAYLSVSSGHTILGDHNDNRVWIANSSGNVGIGTVPTAKLHVAGDIKSDGTFSGNGAGLTNMPEIVPPIQFFAEAGFVQGQAYSPYWEVAYSDTSADCTANFAIRKAGAYKFVMVWETVAANTSKTMSGKIFAISKTNGAAISSYNLFDTENWDLTIPDGARTVSISTFPTAFTVLDQAFVAFDFLKDDNAGGATGNLRIHAMYLIRQ